LAKTNQTQPISLARSGPPSGERVGWSKQESAGSTSLSRAGQGKVASTRPDVIARANPTADQRVAWAKGNADITVPRLTEKELLQQLALAPGVGLGGSAQRVLKSWSSNIKSGMSLGGNGQVMDASPLLSVRPDLTMLPLRSGVNCQLPAKAASTLAVLARKLHLYIDGLAPRKPDGTRTISSDLVQVLREEKRGKRLEWLRVEAVPALLQILMHEDKPLRQLLVDLLAQIKEPRATDALARRAIFDLDPEIRSRARAALKGRNPEEYRAVLLKALRYPWAPVAWNAAEALVTLRDREVIPNLVTLLDQPDPAGVQPLKNRYIMRDLVKIRHELNCLMCHAPSARGDDICMKLDPWVKRRTVMTTKQAAALVASGKIPPSAVQGYGAGGGGGGGRGGGGCVNVESDLMIRFDVNFLKQDFSVQLPVGALGVNQRFDYVVRTRVLTQKQADRMRSESGSEESYPQRDALLFALRRLTFQDAGNTTVAWKKLYPDAEVEVEARRLVQKLLRAGPLELPIVLKSYADGKGDAYTRALTVGATRLSGSGKAQARDALAKRLSELDLEALASRLAHDQPTMRQAAVMACERKKERSLVPHLIARLDDTDADTARLARSALKVITRQDLNGVKAWQEWWKESVTLSD
jgi:HEAT repeat protein